MSSTSLSHHGIDRDALLRVVEPVVHGHGAELVDFEFRPERGGWVLRLYVEREGSAEKNLSTRDAAVNLELCAGISRDLSPALDVADIIPHAYHLEVSSPGVERPLRTERDFVRFTGERAKLKLRDPILSDEAAQPGEDVQRGQRVIVGTLEGVVDGNIRIRDGKRIHDILLSRVESARLVFEFGMSARQPKHNPNANANGAAGGSANANKGQSAARPRRAPTAKRH